MSAHPDGLVMFEAAGEKFTAVLGFKAMKAIETHYGDENGPKPFFIAIQAAMPDMRPEDAGDKNKIGAAAEKIRMTDIGALFGFTLLKYHPRLTEEDVENLIDEIGLEKASEIIGQALTSALVKEGDDSSSAHPRRPKR